MVLSLDNPFRKKLIGFLEWKWFDRFILVVIFINSCSLAAFDPLDTVEINPQSTKRDVLQMASLVFTAIFLAECVFKIIALGLFGKGAYLDSGWNWLDFVIVLISLLDFMPGDGASNLSSLRTLRVMRPLRAITRFQELRFLVMLLLQCIPMLMNVLMLCAFIFFIFGILGVQLWAGVLRRRCYSMEDGSLYSSDYICSQSELGWHICPTGYECLQQHPSPNFDVTHFDHIGAALLTIFQIMTYEGWTVTMYYLQDAYSFWVLLYFIAVLFVGPIFAIQLFLVVISNKFAETKQKQLAGQMALSAMGVTGPHSAKESGGWRKNAKLLLRKLGITSNMAAMLTSQAKFNEKSFRGRARQLAQSNSLSNFIVAIIVINTLFMAMEHDCDILDPDSYCKDFKLSLELANVIFTAIFGIEMVIKFGGLGPISYFSDPYNLFDFLIVVASFVELPDVLTQSQCLAIHRGDEVAICEGGSSGLSVLRAFRIVKLLRAFPALQRQMRIVMASLSAVAWLCLLILLFILIFAILGMSVFGGLMWDPVDQVHLGSSVMLRVPGRTVLLPAVVDEILDFTITQKPYGCKLMYPLDDGETFFVWADAESDIIGHGAQIVGSVPRSHFNTLLYAIVTVFQILTQEDWNQIMYRATQRAGLWSALYFVVLIVIGNYMLLNLFIAIIIQGFAENKESMQDTEEDSGESILTTAKAKVLRVVNKVFGSTKIQPIETESRNSNQSAVVDSSPLSPGPVQCAAPPATPVTVNNDRHTPHSFSEADISSRSKPPPSASSLAPNTWARAGHRASIVRSTMASAVGPPVPPPGKALWLVGPTNQLRRLTMRFISHKGFDQFILFCILLSSILLAIERPGIQDDERHILTIANLTLNCIFIAELLVKVFALSFKHYIASGWNRLDCFIVCASVVDMVANFSGADNTVSSLRILRVFRIFRALRPLRVISRARGLRIVVQTITGSVGPVLNTALIALVVFFIFGILGVQLFSGRLHFCSDPLIWNKEDCVGFEEDGTPRSWENRSINFDHIGEAVLTMFILASQDNWPEIMWSGVDATTKKTGPRHGADEASILFFLCFILVGTFFVLNIFVGVFVDNFNSASVLVKQHMAAEQMRASLLSPATSSTSAAVPANFPSPSPTPVAPRNKLSQLMHLIVTHTAFDIFIAACITLNVASMAFESYNVSRWQSSFLNITNFFFTYVFAIECAMKLLAFHTKEYLRDNWNKFDYTIVMISFVGMAFDESGATIGLNPTILRVLRVFRIFRILRAFRIFKAAKGLQAIVEALGKSLPAIANLAGLLMLLFFIYGILSVELYGNLCTTDDMPSPYYERCLMLDPSSLLDSHATFVNIGMALTTLWRISTGDNWGAIMISCKLAPGERATNAIELARDALANGDYVAIRSLLPGCITEGEFSDLGLECGSQGCQSTCGSMVSPIFFCSFLCMSNFVLLNLVIAVLMEQLAESETYNFDMVTPNLSVRDFARLYWRWKVNAHRNRALRPEGAPLTAKLRLPPLRSPGMARRALSNNTPGSAGGSNRAPDEPTDDIFGADGQPDDDDKFFRPPADKQVRALPLEDASDLDDAVSVDGEPAIRLPTFPVNPLPLRDNESDENFVSKETVPARHDVSDSPMTDSGAGVKTWSTDAASPGPNRQVQLAQFLRDVAQYSEDGDPPGRTNGGSPGPDASLNVPVPNNPVTPRTPRQTGNGTSPATPVQASSPVVPFSDGTEAKPAVAVPNGAGS